MPLIGKDKPNWKGDEALYSVKHAWARRHFGIPKKCEHCKTKNKKVGKKRKISYIQWASISGNHLRKRSDWKTLCPRCHYKFDIKNKGRHLKKYIIKICYLQK